MSKHLPVLPSERPRHRDECRNGIRPCPWASCEHNLRVDIAPGHGPNDVKVRNCTRGVKRTGRSCVLDVVDDGGATLEEVAEILGLTRERIRQIESKALWKISQRAPRLAEAFVATREYTDPDIAKRDGRRRWAAKHRGKGTQP